MRRVGLGPTIVGSALLSSLAWLTIPLAPVSNPIPIVIVGALTGPFFGTMFNLNQLSLRQAITPERLMGRMNSVVRFMYWGTMPVGSFAGGVLATVIGIRSTLFVGDRRRHARLRPAALQLAGEAARDPGRDRRAAAGGSARRRARGAGCLSCPRWRRCGGSSTSRSRAYPILQAGPAHVATLKTFDPPLPRLEGQRLAGARRRGKRLFFPTEDGELVLVVHLMSAGRPEVAEAGRGGAEEAGVPAGVRGRRRSS